MNNICIPSGLEHNQIPDECLAYGYEMTPPQQRVWIKTTLALGGVLYDTHPGDILYSQEHNASGFQVKKFLSPVCWTIILLDKDYASAPRLAAAIMPARLAGVENIIAVWTNQNNISATILPSNLLATLELAGIIHSLTLTHDELLILIHHLIQLGHGRILYFSDRNSPSAPLNTFTSIPIWKERYTYRLAIESNTTIDTEILSWAHPDSCLEELSEKPYIENPPEALYCSVEQKNSYLSHGAQRIFHPGLEAYWVHPTLSTSFFLDTTWDISLLNQKISLI